MTAFNPALLIIDLQNDFLPPNGSLAVPDGDKVIPSILSLLDLEHYPWKTVVATQDWHPPDHISFADSHVNHKPFDEVFLKHPNGSGSKKQILWPVHCVQGTYGSAFPARFSQEWEKLADSGICTRIIRKGYLHDREYYSCFSDIWKDHKTELEQFLQEQEITHVFIAGLAYDFCVLSSAVDSAALGYETFVISDGCKSVSAENDSDTNRKYADNNVKVITQEMLKEYFFII